MKHRAHQAPERADTAVDRRDRVRALGHKGQGLRGSGLRAAGGQAPRHAEALLVALRDVPQRAISRCSTRLPLRSYADITALGREVVDCGYTALKTNIVVPGDPATTVRTLDGNMQPGVLDRIARNIDAFREGVGDAADIALDINFHFKTQPARQIARALEDKGMMWLEFDSFKPSAVREVKDASATPISLGREREHPSATTCHSCSRTPWTSQW